MKLYPLLLGRTKVPYGQFYGGLSGWVGLRALFRFMTDKGHFIWVPIHSYLLEHPNEGLVMFDAGICAEQAHQHSQYYSGIAHYLFDDDEYAKEPNESLAEQLKRLGYTCDDVRTVVLTHLHEDHVGELRHLRKAKVVVSQAEWDNRYMKMYGFVPMFYQPSFDFIDNWERVRFESGAFHCFDKSQDLFGDGTVRLLPTPGHTPGHTCAVIDMGEYQLMVTGDCMYTLRHLATKQVQAFWFSKPMGTEQIASIDRIAKLKKLMPGLHLVVGHDHTQYQWKHLAPALTKGYLSEEDRRDLTQYAAGLFDGDGALRAGSLPRFQPDANGGPVGTVSEP